MNKKFCDRCGIEIPTTGSFFRANHAHFVTLEEIGEPETSAVDFIANGIKKLTASLTGENSREDIQEYELCDCCAISLEKWVNMEG